MHVNFGLNCICIPGIDFGFVVNLSMTYEGMFSLIISKKKKKIVMK